VKRLLPLVLLAAAGCAAADDGPARVEPSHVDAAQRGAADYWMVWAYGTERSTCEGPLCSRAYCSIEFDHEVLPAQRAFRHGNASAPQAPRVVVAFDHHTEGDCPLAYRHAFDPARVAARMGAWGTLAIEVTPEGDVRANGHEVPRGQRATWTYERRGLAGEFHVENLGAWPVARIDARGSAGTAS
jgi:hypothetical protein